MTTANLPRPATRPYDSPLRRQRAIDTRARIVEAGCRLLQRSSIRDWRALTVRAVAEQAGVNERTVYRYFGNERGLRDAVMARLEASAGIDLDGMGLGDVAEVAARIFTFVSAYPPRSRPTLDPTLTDAGHRQRQALVRAIADPTGQWSAAERNAAAAVLDVLWSVATYERLVADWEMDRDQAVRTVTWALGLVAEAIEGGRRPPGAVEDGPRAAR